MRTETTYHTLRFFFATSLLHRDIRLELHVKSVHEEGGHVPHFFEVINEIIRLFDGQLLIAHRGEHLLDLTHTETAGVIVGTIRNGKLKASNKSSNIPCQLSCPPSSFSPECVSPW